MLKSLPPPPSPLTPKNPLQLIRTAHFIYRFYDHSYFIRNYNLFPKPLDANRHRIFTYIAHNGAENDRFRNDQTTLKELISNLEAQAAISCFAHQQNPNQQIPIRSPHFASHFHKTTVYRSENEDENLRQLRCYQWDKRQLKSLTILIRDQRMSLAGMADESFTAWEHIWVEQMERINGKLRGVWQELVGLKAEVERVYAEVVSLARGW
ncbi:MAG: hypothetical protein Q9184_000744 [Pyrenodesmia sp. 2 TL-2023]